MNDAEIRAQVDIGDNGGFVKLGNNIKKCDSQAQYLKFKIDDLKAGISQMESMPNDFGKTDILQAKTELEKLEGQYSKLTNVQEVSSTSLEKGLNKGVKSIKRFGLAIFGLGSVWSLVSRAYTQYISQNQDLSNKMQAVWVGLGSFLAPIIEKIADFTIRAIKYLNVFITALTGVDLLARSTSKSMNKLGKSTAKASKNLAGFDEIINLDSAGGGLADSSWVEAFNDVKLNDNLVVQLSNLGTKVKEIWNKYFSPFFTYLRDNWDTAGKDIVGLILLIGIVIDAATGNWLGLIIKFVGFIALYWNDIVAIVKFAVNLIWEIIKSVGLAIWGIIQLAVEIIKAAVSVIVGVITTAIELVKGIFNSIITTISGVINGIKTIFTGLIDFITGVFTGNWKKAWEGVKTIFKGVFDTLWSIVKFPLNLIIDGINALISGLNKLQIKMPDWLGGKSFGLNIPKIPKLNVGTNYVGSDGLAYLHKGEAVIPKKFNSQEYFNGNDELANKLDLVIGAIENIEFSPYTTVKDVGNASARFLNQQKRILGEDVI